MLNDVLSKKSVIGTLYCKISMRIMTTVWSATTTQRWVPWPGLPPGRVSVHQKFLLILEYINRVGRVETRVH